MREPSPGYRKLLESGIVSKPYASQIASGERMPSLKLAVAIYVATGLKFGRLVGASAQEISALKRVVERGPSRASA